MRKPVARIGSNPGFAVYPTGAAATHVSLFQILSRERQFLFEELDDSFGKLRARGPGFIHAGAGENIGAPGAFADSRVAVSHKERLATAPRFLQRLCAPGLQRSALQMAPQIRMQNKVLQIAIGRAHGTAEPRRNEDANGGQTVRMDIEEAKNLRLRETERVQNRSCLQSGILAKLDHHLHAQCPFGMFVPRRQAEMRIDAAADSAHGSISDHRQRRANVHSWQKTILWRAVQSGALIRKAYPLHGAAFD